MIELRIQVETIANERGIGLEVRKQSLSDNKDNELEGLVMDIIHGQVEEVLNEVMNNIHSVGESVGIPSKMTTIKKV